MNRRLAFVILGLLGSTNAFPAPLSLQTVDKPQPAAAADKRATVAAQYEADLVNGLKRLEFVRGDWTVMNYQMTQEGQWKLQRRDPLRFDWVVGDRFIEATGKFQTDFRMTLGFNVTKKTYQLALIDAQSGLLDVYSGAFDDTGRMVLTNGHNFRWEIAPTADGFQALYLHSPDEGATWKAFGRNDFISARTPLIR